MFLPDIPIDRYIISIQYPYTINGELITNIDLYLNEMRICFTSRSICDVLQINSLKDKFYSEMSWFIRNHGRHASVDSERPTDWSCYTFENWINDISAQCSQRNIWRLESLLRRQGRYQHQTVYQQTLHAEDYPIGGWQPIDHSRNIEFHNNTGVATGLVGTYEGELARIVVPAVKKYIHRYNYKPEYIPYRCENENTSLLLGAEIEVDCGGESEKHAKGALKIFCGTDPDSPDEALENKMYCTHDGSLMNGIEFDTMPMSLEYHKTQKYKEMFEYLDKNGYKAHDTKTCGLHVHADRTYLGDTEFKRQLTITKIIYILEKFNDEVCAIARRDSKYSEFAGKDTIPIELYKKYKDKGKHVALNLSHKETIEFRCFKSTLKYETFILTLEFVQNIIDFAKAINIEEIETMTWDDLVATFSEDLKEYYEKRREIEAKKQKKSYDLQGTSTISTDRSYINMALLFEGVPNRNNTSFNLSQIATPTLSDVGSDTISELSRHVYDGFSATVNDTLYNYIIESFDRTYNNSINEEPTIQSVKKEIKNLKQKIKRTNYHMERTQLQQELNEKQKLLKKLKRSANAA